MISQSTNTCLTVLSGTGPRDAVVGLAEYTGSGRQQWFVQGGQWQWAENRSLCLSPDEGRQGLCLVPAGTSSAFWTLNEEGIFGTESRALDVPWEEPRTKVILYPAHGGQNQRWWTVSLISMWLELPRTKDKLSKAAVRIHEVEAGKRKALQDAVDGGPRSQCECQGEEGLAWCLWRWEEEGQNSYIMKHNNDIHNNAMITNISYKDNYNNNNSNEIDSR